MAEARPPADAVSTGVPAVVSEYWKLNAPLPAGIVRGDAGVNMPVEEVVLRLTVKLLPASTGLPRESSRVTVIVPEIIPAVSVAARL